MNKLIGGVLLIIVLVGIAGFIAYSGNLTQSPSRNLLAPNMRPPAYSPGN